MAKIFKTGNSLAVTVPSYFTQSLGLKSGDEVKVSARVGKGQILYQFSGVHQLSFTEDLNSHLKKKK